MDGLTITISGPPDTGACVSVAGEIDVATIALIAGTTDLLDPATTIVVDLRGVTFVDSTGLRWLIHLHKRARSHGTTICVVPSHAVRRLLDVAGMAFLIGDPPAARGAGPAA